MITKNCLDILMEQLFAHFSILYQQLFLPKILDLYFNDNELIIATLIGFPSLFIGD